jgi:uncharacterized protein (TIGR03437 family)
MVGEPSDGLQPAKPPFPAPLTLNRPPPTITTFTPVAGAPGSRVTIRGTNFENTRTVWFNGVKATIKTHTATVLEIIVPKRVKTGKITVKTTNGGGSER